MLVLCLLCYCARSSASSSAPYPPSCATGAWRYGASGFKTAGARPWAWVSSPASTPGYAPYLAGIQQPFTQRLQPRRLATCSYRMQVHCLAQRIRLHEDGWNRGFAGCATGLVIGWNGGPVSALQSCAGLGLISYIVDFGGKCSYPVPSYANT